ncbi:phage tail sheath subtilisin-like domain-containing protein [Azohydromonas lata]|uniref:Phage tail sheath subtilisin-like domain-containing protein n=1 Tax=Azohydromonas lata TaxID=45677 RepID=A0ABU5IQX7_9BURK|nr:phage tail sheath subtilisin-like domain-containing protein [Azohydromonas lata]MDZ5461296.1 phage tail sheath subtilisin-like domain-containing protein [Azohydromonas lata]
MPEYLAPGVYVEETSFRAKSIEGVSTSTSAFVGPTRRGPVGVRSELITSLGEFERYYGSQQVLALTGATTYAQRINHLAQAVRNYFDNGGSRLYVVRTANGAVAATRELVANPGANKNITALARFPGEAGNGRLTMRVVVKPVTGTRALGALPAGSMVQVTVGQTTTQYVKAPTGAWQDATTPTPGTLAVTDATVAQLLTLTVEFTDADGATQVFDELGFAAGHPRWAGTVLAADPANRADALVNALGLQFGSAVTPFELRTAVLALAAVPNDPDGRRFTTLGSGSDGTAPVIGDATTAGTYTHALAQLVGVEDVSIVAAPGSSAYADAAAVALALITHAESRRAYRIAVLDTPALQTPQQVRDARAALDSRYAALYYPWVITANPMARPGRDDIPREIALPPSGFVCGVYARNDSERGVHKAPANEVVRGALRFQADINFAQQEALNPSGVNCLRLLPGRGLRVWGARLISSDPEWKYVSDRRYFNYLEASIDRGTQWAVFEPNGEALWANVRQTISDFLLAEWRNGAMLGTTPEQAFFVRCDRSTMTQNDLDNGRLICLIGVAIVKPAEFVIFRIGQKTADARE